MPIDFPIYHVYPDSNARATMGDGDPKSFQFRVEKPLLLVLFSDVQPNSRAYDKDDYNNRHNGFSITVVK